MNAHSYNQIREYIDKNPIATLGTLNNDGTPHGAAVYICADAHGPIVYFITKQETLKLKNLRTHPNVSLTVVHPSENSTLQASGRADEINDAKTIDIVMDTIARKHDFAADWLPPIAKLRAGAYVVIGVHLSSARLAYFKDASIGDEHIFTEL